MADQARVHSIEALRRVREALVGYAEGVSGALGAVEAEIHRAREWLEHQQPSYWKGQIRLWNQRQAEARSALHRKHLQRTDGFVPDETQEKEALRLCKRKIEEAERKLAAIRQWGPKLQQAISEYKGRSRPLADVASIDIPAMVAQIDRMIEALEAYRTTPPSRRSGSRSRSSADSSPPSPPADAQPPETS